MVFFFFISLQFVNLQVIDVLGYYYNFINYHVRLNVMTLRHDTNIWRLISIKTYDIEPLSVQCQICFHFILTKNTIVSEQLENQIEKNIEIQ
jgi:hypothetical protein